MGRIEKNIFILLTLCCLVLNACFSQMRLATNTPPELHSTPEITPSIEFTPSLENPFTSTPILLSQCPEGNAELIPDFSQAVSADFPRLEEPILNFLNSGGTTQAVIKALEWTDQQGLSPDWSYDSSIKNKEEFNETHLFTRDLTSDGIPELIISRVNLYIFGCKENKYQTLLAVENEGWINHAGAPWIIKIEDMNLNRTPEIIVKSYLLGAWTLFRIFEWSPRGFKSLLIPLKNSTYSDFADDGFAIQMGEVLLEDTDSNGILDFVLRGYDPFPKGLPSRGEQYIYKWNGEAYTFSSKDFSPPVYRFEAVQDGDRYSLDGDYEKALMRYQDAILADPLEWWSSERNQYEVNCWDTKPNCPFFPNTPIPDKSAYSNLSAYSYFRIMVIHIILGDMKKAQFFYNYLQSEFSQGQTGSAYAEMAKEFWDEYEITEDRRQSCNKAIEYATANPTEILAYLGNGKYAIAYFGEQSLVFTPADICPFK